MLIILRLQNDANAVYACLSVAFACRHCRGHAREEEIARDHIVTSGITLGIAKLPFVILSTILEQNVTFLTGNVPISLLNIRSCHNENMYESYTI